jgi:hypothetical protein
MLRLVLALLCALTGLTGFAATAQAAAPWLILVTGESFEGRAYLNSNESFRIYDEVVNSTATVSRTKVEDRLFLDLALFWGSNGRGQPITSLRAEDADQQHGRFYPATDDEPAAVYLPLVEHPNPSQAGSKLLSILARHGVPVRLKAESGTREWLLPGVIGGGMAVALLALGALSLRRRTHRPLSA